jgi:pyruvate, orthophosphate dikinase
LEEIYMSDVFQAAEATTTDSGTATNKKYVYLFNEVEQAEQHAGDWDGVRALLGGKGANLADMTRIGIPVPPGFTVSTEACLAYLDRGGEFPPGMWEEELAAMAAVEEMTGKKFGDPTIRCSSPADLAPSSRCLE